MAQAPEQVAERQHDGQPAPAWQWARTEQTRSDLLAAAREVFAEQGYTCAKVTDIAARAGLSVGSIYHHFGGKNELYLALWRATTSPARKPPPAPWPGPGTPALPILPPCGRGSPGHPADHLEAPDLAALFCAGNGPPDFEDMRQHRSSPGRPGHALLRISGSSGDPLLAAVLAALLSEGAKAIVAAASHRQAETIIIDILEYGRRLMAAGPPGDTAQASRPEDPADLLGH